MDINNLSKPITAVCLITILLLAGIGFFIPNYQENHACELVIPQEFQVEAVTIRGLNSFTITGAYLGAPAAPTFATVEGYPGDVVQFLVSGGSVPGVISDMSFHEEETGDLRFQITGNSQRLLMPGAVKGLRFAGKRVDF